MASKDALIQQLEESRKNTEQLVAELGPNAKNAVTVTEREALSFDHVYRERQRTHDQIKIAIRDLLPENGRIDHLPLGQISNVEDLVTGFIT